MDSSERIGALVFRHDMGSEFQTWGRLGLIREKTTTFSVDGQVPHDCSRTIQIVESPDFGLDGSRTVNNAFF